MCNTAEARHLKVKDAFCDSSEKQLFDEVKRRCCDLIDAFGKMVGSCHSAVSICNQQTAYVAFIKCCMCPLLIVCSPATR